MPSEIDNRKGRRNRGLAAPTEPAAAIPTPPFTTAPDAAVDPVARAVEAVIAQAAPAAETLTQTAEEAVMANMDTVKTGIDTAEEAVHDTVEAGAQAVTAAVATPAPVAPEAVLAASPVTPVPDLQAVPTPPPAPKESFMATAFETTQETVKNTVHQLNAQAETALSQGKAAMEQMTAKSHEAVEASIKSLGEMTELAKGNVEALLASARAATAGIEQISAHVAELSRKSFEDSTAMMRALAAAKTPNELFQLQSDHAKAQFDTAVAEFGKMSEMMVKLAGEITEPMQNRMALAADRMKTVFTK